MRMKGAIFLDRDGTINELNAGGYVTTPEAFHFLPGTLDALAFLAQNSERRIVIMTNQACVGRGLVAQEQVAHLHAWMVEQIEGAGGRVDGVYVCPHAPDAGCLCRKPEPGLLLQAALDLDLDLAASALIGDAASDLRAAWAAGVSECYYVLTGDGSERPPRGGPCALYAYLADAIRAAIERERRARDETTDREQ